MLSELIAQDLPLAEHVLDVSVDRLYFAHESLILEVICRAIVTSAHILASRAVQYTATQGPCSRELLVGAASLADGSIELFIVNDLSHAHALWPWDGALLYR